MGGQEPPPPTEGPGDEADIVGARERLISIGMTAVLLACVVFAVARLAAELTSGLRTPWWGNAVGALALGLLYLWYARAPARRSTAAVHGTAAVATAALLVPAFYGFTSSKWWLALVGFAVLLMGRRREAMIWAGITLALVPLVALYEPSLAVPGARGETSVERALAGLAFVALLLGITLAFRREAERRARRLTDMADSLDRANQVRSRFLAHMSHELRTPLHATIAMTDLALSGPLDERARPHLSGAHDSALLLSTLLNNILDVTRAEAGAIELHARPFALHARVGEAVRTFVGPARARGVRLEATAEEGLQTKRIGDAPRVMQIVLNLVGNALKFTREGAVEVRLGVDPDDEARVYLEVRDTGPGIAPDQLARIFTPFVQSVEDSGPFEEGAGLGLSIARALARAMGGDVEVRSERGVGSTFTAWMRLPTTPDDPPEPGPTDLLSAGPERAETPSAPARGLRILVCEDHATSRRALGRMLKRLGHTTTLVEDGARALERLDAETFDLLITDVEMPGVDGHELLRRVRSSEQAAGGPALPIIAATAHVGREEWETLRGEGADLHLPKPFTLEQLARALTDVAGG